MLGFMGILTILGPVIEVLDKVLESAGLDRQKRSQIIDELVSRLKRGGRSLDSKAAAFEVWEYGVVTLGRKRWWARNTALAPVLRDGVEIPAIELSAYLNEMSEEGWELLSTIGSERSSTLVLVRPRQLGL